jgi:Ni,Fe-hydrogenase I small subunit
MAGMASLLAALLWKAIEHPDSEYIRYVDVASCTGCLYGFLSCTPVEDPRLVIKDLS